MVTWSHVAASVWLPLAITVPHQDPVPLLHPSDNGSIPATKLPWRPPIPWSYSWGPAAAHFSGSFIHGVTVPMEHGWSGWREGEREVGWPQWTPLCQSCYCSSRLQCVNSSNFHLHNYIFQKYGESGPSGIILTREGKKKKNNMSIPTNKNLIFAASIWVEL